VGNVYIKQTDEKDISKKSIAEYIPQAVRDVRMLRDPKDELTNVCVGTSRVKCDKMSTGEIMQKIAV
jgi:hypothetical protein